MKKIKILVSCHRQSYVYKSPYLSSIQVGTALAGKKIEADYYDDIGENISQKNKMYCEMTAQYWAYKNLEADYYGFFHYRRYLAFQEIYTVNHMGKLSKKAKCPYREIPSIKENLAEFGLEEERMREVIESHDIITLLREKMNVTVYRQYCQFHNRRDIDLLIQVVEKMYPEYREALYEYMDSKELYFMNMYIMKKEYFHEYASFAFSVLEEVEKQLRVEDYSEAELRVIGYLAERLFGVYYTKKRKEKNIKCCELMYLIFGDTSPYEKIHPYFDESAISVVMASNNSFSPYLSVLLQSVIDASDEKKKYDLVVLHTDISAHNQSKIMQMKTDHVSIRFFNVKDYVQNISFQVHHHLSKETFYRYFIPDIFAEWDKILYLDADMIVKQDVAELFEEKLDGYLLGAVVDIESSGNCKGDESYKRYLQTEVGLENPAQYFQAGILLFNLTEFRRQVKTKELIDKTLEKDWRMLDQDVLNWKCQGKVKFVDMKWNVMMNWIYCGKSRMDMMKQAPYMLYQEYLSARKMPCIIHYAGAWKPWEYPNCDFALDFWQAARKTPFYEMIVYGNARKQKQLDLSEPDSYKRTFVLKPTKIEIAVDMKKVNAWFPPGSRRRVWLRNLVLH